METIGLIAAMPEEIKPLLRQVGRLERTRVGQFPAYRFQLSGRSCLLIQSGVGLRRAKDAARALAGGMQLQFLVSFGIGGAVQDDLRVGDVLAAHSVCTLLDEEVPGQFQPLARLAPEAQEAAAGAAHALGVRFFMGTSITTRGAQTVRLESLEIEHPVLEMETAGIAQVAVENGLPLLALRAISDSVEEPLPFDIQDFMDRDSNLRPGRVISAVFRHPDLLWRLRRLRRNSALAAENVTQVLLAVLSQPSSPFLGVRI